MKILFDQGTPVPLQRHLTGHIVKRGWFSQFAGDSFGKTDENLVLRDS